jgi:hypothetical protein
MAHLLLLNGPNLTLARACVARGARGEQRRDGRPVVLVRGPHQCGLTLPTFARIRVGAMLEQCFDCRDSARACCGQQRRLALGERRLDVRAVLEEELYHRGVAVLARKIEGLHAVAIGGAHLGAGAKECGREFEMIGVHGPVQCGCAVRARVVRIAALLEQRACERAVTALRRIEQRACLRSERAEPSRDRARQRAPA